MPNTQTKRRKALLFCAAACAALLLLFVASATIGDAALAPDFGRKGLAPCPAYPFGTDWLGRNLLPRTIKGLTLSLVVGLLSAVASAVFAAAIGMAAAAGNRLLNGAVNLCIDLILGVPHLVLLILISVCVGRGEKGLMLGIALTHWPSLARVIRAESLQVRAAPYVAVSRQLGHTPLWVARHHIAPHIVPQLVVGLVLLFPHAVLHEASLSFLGFGLPPEQPAIGILLAESMNHLTSGIWWAAFFPGVSLVLLVLLFHALGKNMQVLLAQ